MRAEIRRTAPSVNIPSFVALQPTGGDATVREYNFEGLVMPTAEAVQGGTFEFRLNILNAVGSTLTINRLTVRWEPVQVYYQEGIEIDMETAAPKDMTLADLVTGVSNVLNLKFTTDDRTGAIIVRHYDDLFKPTSEGRDWRGRETHDPPIVKVSPHTPSRYIFRWKEDNKDEDLRNINEVYPSPGWGNLDFELGGSDKEVKVETIFAPTNMGPIVEDLWGPTMRNIDAPYQTNKIEYVPRLLIADGVVDGLWTHSGDALTQCPKTFFVWPNDLRYSLAYENNEWYGIAARGTANEYFLGQMLRVRDSKILSIHLRIDDDELVSFDFTRPVMVSDGVNDGWYYIIKVDQKQFGTDAFTRCDLLQL